MQKRFDYDDVDNPTSAADNDFESLLKRHLDAKQQRRSDEYSDTHTSADSQAYNGYNNYYADYTKPWINPSEPYLAHYMHSQQYRPGIQYALGGIVPNALSRSAGLAGLCCFISIECIIPNLFNPLPQCILHSKFLNAMT